MQVGGNAAEAISNGREGVEALPTGSARTGRNCRSALAVAAGIVPFMLGLRWVGAWLSRAIPTAAAGAA